MKNFWRPLVEGRHWSAFASKIRNIYIYSWSISFQSSLLRNCFCKRDKTLIDIFDDEDFQSSLLRNCFCKIRGTEGKSFVPRELSILVVEELLLQVLVRLLRGNKRANFQSSWLRNCFCKRIKFRVWHWKARTLSILVSEELLLQVW